MNAQRKQLDDLTVIKGIGPTRQEWLRKSFDIRTYDDLAALSPDELETQLKAEGRIAARAELEGWLLQAQRLANQATAPSPALLSRPHSLGMNNPLVDSVNHWQAFASYVVEFQMRTAEAAQSMPEYRTVVHHMEADIGQTWPGINTTDLCEWILAQADPAAPEAPLVAPQAVTTVEVETPLRLAINQLRLIQQPDVAVKLSINEAHRTFPGGIKSSEPLALEVDFILSGQAVPELINRQTQYNAQFHLRNLATGTSIHLGDSTLTPLVAEKDGDTTRLSNIRLAPGLYRLRAIVSVHSRPPIIDFIEVPLLQVV